jgi:hypothetical protein
MCVKSAEATCTTHVQQSPRHHICTTLFRPAACLDLFRRIIDKLEGSRKTSRFGEPSRKRDRFQSQPEQVSHKIPFSC